MVPRITLGLPVWAMRGILRVGVEVSDLCVEVREGEMGNLVDGRGSEREDLGNREGNNLNI